MPLTEEENRKLQEANERLNKAMAEVVEASKLYLGEVRGITANHGEETRAEANRLMHDMIESAQTAMEKGKEAAIGYMDTAKVEAKRASDYGQERLGELRKRFDGDADVPVDAARQEQTKDTELNIEESMVTEPPSKKADVREAGA